MARFVYRGGNRDAATVTRKANQSGGMYDSFIKSDAKVLKIKEGENILRVMPGSWPDEDVEKWGEFWNIDIYLHYSVGADNGTYLCLEQMKGEPCPVCEARATTDDDEERDQLRASWRGLAYAIDRDDEKAGPQVFSIPVTLFRDINERSVDKKTKAVIKIDDPDNGYDIGFTRKGADIRTKYTGVEVMRDDTPLHDDQKIQDRWLQYITDNPLPDLLVFHDYEHIAKVLVGKRRRGEDEEEQSEPRGRRTERARREEPEERTERRSGSGRTSARLEEPEDEPEARPARRASRRDEPEEETEAAPRRSARSSGRPAAEEPVDDGFQEEPAPKSARRPVTRRDEPEEAPAEADEEPSASARRSLERMRERRRA